MKKFKLPSRSAAADRLSDVRSEKTKLLQRIKELEREESDLVFYLDALRKHGVEATDGSMSAPGINPKPKAAPMRRGPKTKKGESITKLAREVLLEADFMPIEMLVTEMKKRGWDFSDNYIRCRQRVRNEMLRRPNIFTRPARGMWSVAREEGSAAKAEGKGGDEIA